jgi:hypothetical protein
MATYQYTPMPAVEGPQTMSIGDMINTARAGQAYQQSQQMNPLAVQQQQQIVAKGGIELGQQQQADRERRNLQEFFANPDNFQTNGRIDIDKINKVVPTIAPYTGSEYVSKYTTLGKAQTEAIGAKQNLTQDQRAMIAQRFSILGRLGVDKVEPYLNEMELMKKENPDNPDFARLLDSYKTIWQTEMKSGPDLPGKAIAGAQTLLTPAQQQTTFAPSISTQDGRTVVTTPGVGAKQPTAEVGTAGGLQQGGPKELPTAGSEVAPGMRIPYAVRSAAQPFIPEPTEAKDTESGAAYRDSLVNRQTALSTNRRNVEETIGQAQKIYSELYFPEGGVRGDLERKIKTAIASDQYKQLAKDLAQLQLSNLQAMGQGGGTVAGIDLTKVASGDISVPPDVLIKIARRTQSDITNLDMQAQGAQQFKQRFGDNNMKAYQQAWNANAKSEIFEAMNLSKEIDNPEQLKKELDKLFPSKAKHDEFLKKYRNLKRLSETGTQ